MEVNYKLSTTLIKKKLWIISISTQSRHQSHEFESARMDIGKESCNP